MEHADDEQLKELLLEWRIDGAPISLDAKVLGRSNRWRPTITKAGLFVPLRAAAIVAALVALPVAALLWHPPAASAPSKLTLVGFQPAPNLNARIIRGNYAGQ